MRRNLILLIVAGVIVLALAFFLRPGEEADHLTAEVVPGTPIPIEGFSHADGSHTLSFPEDFGPHPDFQTEWWYYTGNLDDENGRHFGYELTFFRVSLVPPDQSPARSSSWGTTQFYMAHFALTDVEAGEFHAFQRYQRGVDDLAGAQADPYHVWLEDWDVQQVAANRYELVASNEGLRIDLQLTDEKGPVLQGDSGYSRKGADPNSASYYYSETRLVTEGEVQIGEQVFQVSGLSWKDHEFSTNALESGQVGWDWFSIQLDDGYEVMLYQIRRADGSVDPFSSGTLIAPDGTTQQLALDDFLIDAQGTWHSPHSNADYPMGWSIQFPEANLELALEPFLEDQELNLATIYWEGAVRITGTHNGAAVSGVGYVEMTGYAAPLSPGL
jgi:predicted secreted hydrolase